MKPERIQAAILYAELRNFTLRLSPEGAEDDTVVIAKHKKKKGAAHGDAGPAASGAQLPTLSDRAIAAFAAVALIVVFAGLYFFLR